MAIRVSRSGEALVRPPAAKRPRRPSRAAGLVPAASRAPTALSTRELDLSGDAIETFATAVGGRATLLATLAVADVDGQNDKVINCLLDPQYRSWSLRRICAYAGLTVADLFASYKKALFVQAHVQAAHTITSKLPPIVEDVMTRAAPQPIRCPRCYGVASPVEGAPACPLCSGSGQILSEPDLDRQKLALELGKLTAQHKGGVMVQQNAIAAGAAALTSTHSGSLEQLQQAVGELLFAPGRRRTASPAATIEAAVIDAHDPPLDPRAPLDPPAGSPAGSPGSDVEEEDDLVDDPDEEAEDAEEVDDGDDEPEPRRAS